MHMHPVCGQEASQPPWKDTHVTLAFDVILLGCQSRPTLAVAAAAAGSIPGTHSSVVFLTRLLMRSFVSLGVA